MNGIWKISVYCPVCGSRELRRGLPLQSVIKARRGWNGYMPNNCCQVQVGWQLGVRRHKVGLWLEPLTSGLRRTPTNVMAREPALSP